MLLKCMPSVGFRAAMSESQLPRGPIYTKEAMLWACE